MDHCIIEGSENFFTAWGMNSVLECLRQRRLDYIHFKIRLATLSNCAMEVKGAWGAGFVELGVI